MQVTRSPGDNGRTSSELTEKIRAEILRGRVAPGLFVPPVRSMMKRYGAAKKTVDRILDGLIAGDTYTRSHAACRASCPIRSGAFQLYAS